MAEPNNAAGQLIYWFEQAREHDPDNNLQLLSVWCDVWNLDSNDPRDRATFMSMAANLSDLAETVRHEVTELDDLFPSAVLLEDFEQVEEALGEFLDTTTGLRAQLGNIRETGWKGLRSLDAFLSRHRPGTVVNREGIAQLLDYVNTLVRAVLSDGELEEDLRRYLIKQLTLVEQALREAMITGEDGIEVAVNSLIGAISREPGLWERIGKSKFAPSVKGVILALLMGVDAVSNGITILEGVEPDPEIVVQLIQPAPDPPALNPAPSKG